VEDKEWGSLNLSNKETLFRTLFHEKFRAIELINAVTGATYTPNTPIVVYSTEKHSLLAPYNEVAYKIMGKLYIFVENSSFINPNMPLILLKYLNDVVTLSVGGIEAIFGDTFAQMPPSQLYYLHTGAEIPKQEVLRLSDAYMKKTSEPSFDLVVNLVDLNYKRGKIASDSSSLGGYVYLTSLIQKYQQAGGTKTDAINQAVDTCLSENILSDFLTHRRKEIVGMFECQDERERSVFGDATAEERKHVT